MKKNPTLRGGPGPAGYDTILTDLSAVIQDARTFAARTVNAVMTAAYWLIGRRIVEYDQSGQERAAYGEELLVRLAGDLGREFGRGFSRQNLQQMRQFYLTYPSPEIRQTASSESERGRDGGSRPTPSGESPARPGGLSLRSIAERFLLPWSAYVRLLSVKNESARRFYETEALRGGWSVRQLRRQIDSQFYERTALSKDKAVMLEKGRVARPGDAVSPREAIKDPFVLEFLDLKDEYSESDLEEALIRHLEIFLLELGSDFCFIGRQKRLRVGDAWYRVDLIFFHRRLRCLVVIDLKIGAFTHADAGQMHLYLNYAREHWTHQGENPPVGLMLCAEKDAAVAHYALEGLPNKVMAAEYRTALPDEEELSAEIKRTRALIEERRAALPEGDNE